ncbi:MAG: glucose-6-phosphate isomerase, partial [Desulfobacteraceae bacterium]|nr:glucose-6-phosphate isomerase [Desulfobacteraceae bacterium]
DDAVLKGLIQLTEDTKALETFKDMAFGKKVNVTEKRAALHTAARDVTHTDIMVDDLDVIPAMNKVNQNIQAFTKKIHNKELTSNSKKKFTHAVVVGIGGSYLGCEFVYEAMKNRFDPIIELLFLPNVDIDNFCQVKKKVNPETCLWIVVSKSYTTTETMANLNLALHFLKTNHLDPKDHLVTITAKGSPGDDPKNPILSSFHMFDFIGGRYSVSSAVGGLPLSLAFGFDVFKEFLDGCHQMDLHALTAEPLKNIPLVSALISIWNSNFLNYPAQAVIPYCSALSKLAPHVQQLYMESLGKMVTKNGQLIDNTTGVLIFGEPGTNAQHSFFQLAHQGMAFPIEFIGVVNPEYSGEKIRSKGVDNHQELWANLLAQTKALAIGKDDENPARFFPGNRPSSTIVLNDLSPKSIGQLLSFYETRTVLEGFILGLNPFDQFGVELGKILASNIREEMEMKNQDAQYSFDTVDSATRFYLEKLFEGQL